MVEFDVPQHDLPAPQVDVYVVPVELLEVLPHKMIDNVRGTPVQETKIN